MRAAILTFLATLWFASAPAFANGETGILIVTRFQFNNEHSHNQSIVICEEDWKKIRELVDTNDEAQIELQDNGTYAVEEGSDGQLRIRLLVDDSRESYSLVSRECPVQPSKKGC